MEEKNDKKVNISLTFSYWVIILFFIVFYIYQSESYKQGYDQITESIHTLYDSAEKGFILPLDGDLSDHSFSEKVASVLKQTQSLFHFYLNNLDKQYSFFTLWSGVLTILFLVFSFYAIFKLEDALKKIEKDFVEKKRELIHTQNFLFGKFSELWEKRNDYYLKLKLTDDSICNRDYQEAYKYIDAANTLQSNIEELYKELKGYIPDLKLSVEKRPYIINYYKAVIFYKQQKYRDAFRSIKEVLRFKSADYFEIIYYSCLIFCMQKDEEENTIKYGEEVIRRLSKQKQEWKQVALSDDFLDFSINLQNKDEYLADFNEFLVALSTAYLKIKKSNEVIRLFNIYSNYVKDDYNCLSRLFLAYRLERRWEDARICYEKLQQFANFQDEVSPRYGMARLYIEQAAYYNDENNILKLLNLPPTHSEKYIDGLRVKAQKELEEIISEKPDPNVFDKDKAEVQMWLGLVYAERKEWDKAIDIMEKINADNVRYTHSEYEIGRVYFFKYCSCQQREEKEKYARLGESYLKKAIGKDPETASYHFYLGLLYREKGEYEEALKPLNLACSLDNSKIYYDKDLASVYYKLAENNKDETTKYTYLKKASIHLESAIRKDAEKLSKYPYAIGLAYWEEKVWKSFIAEHNPSGVIEGDPQLCYSLSKIYYEMKLYDKAKLVIEKAILIKPDPSYHELLSQVNTRINLLNKSLN